jgi:hypothetical protein
MEVITFIVILLRLCIIIHMKNIIKSIEKFMAKGKFENFADANEVFSWWISNDSVNKYLARKEQMLIRYDEEER